MKALEHPYAVLSDLVKYPGPGFRGLLDACPDALRDYPETLTTLESFIEYTRELPPTELEELYTRTFDIHAICHLDVGYVMFGEDYKRGRFLVEMKREHAEAQTSCEAELPDHLPYVLTLLTVMKDKERASELVRYIVLPAVDKMRQNFKKKGNVYGAVIEAVYQVLRQDYGMPEILPVYASQEATL